jgi:hypothetical protein
MPLTHQDRSWFFAYEMMSKGEQALVVSGFREFTNLMREWGLTPAADDRAGSLQAALARFVIESREEPPEQPKEEA